MNLLKIMLTLATCPSKVGRRGWGCFCHSHSGTQADREYQVAPVSISEDKERAQESHLAN